MQVARGNAWVEMLGLMQHWRVWHSNSSHREVPHKTWCWIGWSGRGGWWIGIQGSLSVACVAYYDGNREVEHVTHTFPLYCLLGSSGLMRLLESRPSWPFVAASPVAGSGQKSNKKVITWTIWAFHTVNLSEWGTITDKDGAYIASNLLQRKRDIQVERRRVWEREMGVVPLIEELCPTHQHDSNSTPWFSSEFQIQPTAYGPCLPCPCQVFLPISFMTLPRLQQIQHTYLTHLLADDIHKCFSAYIPSLEHW